MQQYYTIPFLFVCIHLLFHERVFSDKSILDHIKFSYECFDRVITNCIAKNLQYEKGLSAYLFEECGGISREAVKARTNHIHEQMEKLAKEEGIEIKKIDTRVNLLQLAMKDLKKLEPIPDGEDRIIAMYKQLAYCNSWNFNTEKNVLQRKIRRVYQYSAYHFDRDFGLGSHTLSTYLPNNIRGYFNQHNWMIQQLKQQGLYNDDIKMYYNSFQDIGTIDPEKFQSLCDSISYDHIWKYDLKWISTLWPDIESLPYRSHFNEIEFSSNLIFKQKNFLNRYYLNHIIYAYDLSLPEKLSLIFKRRIDKRYKYPFKTKLSIVETKPCLKVTYKSNQLKEYIKNHDHRTELTINNPTDFGLKKTDLDGIRNVSRGINQRAMSIQQSVDPNWIHQELDHNPFERIKVKEKWIPGIKINDEKMTSVMKGLIKTEVNGQMMRDLTDFVNQDQGLQGDCAFTISQISYAVRKLRGHGLVEKLEGKNRYRPTPAGIPFFLMFLRVTEKVIFPFAKNIMRLANKSKYFRTEYEPANTKADHLKKLNSIYKSIEKRIMELFDCLDIIETSDVTV